ncbi:hypothetical protein KC343_g7793 [Hortaea werneckii]|nr:hypothetical protein KC352_g18206 [Hortaea werneckii]KAI7560440.1 hypothetical protein KC317_g9727 [Hortaea werneckii]KAI7614914.1 hypothetical protein KC346_g6725 [Hortaea werneckii]KAI7622005.1 hypothetical protein KC343_g7793 [Hortaea werneckii]KAI7667394.1 hypothetical protein KC319_g6692 [Hortaea werneckii]
MASASNQRYQGRRHRNRQRQGPREDYNTSSQESTQAAGMFGGYFDGVFSRRHARANQEYDLDMSGYVTAEEHEQLWEENATLKEDARASFYAIRDLEYERNDFRGQVLHMKKIINDFRQLNDAAKRDRRAQEAKATDLQQQLLTFKRGIAASTRTENQLTDDEVRQKMDRVFYGIQNFVLEILRGKDLDRIKLSNEGKSPQLGHTLVLDEADDKSCLVQLIIGLVATIVVELADPEHLFGLPTDNTALKAIASFAAHMKVSSVASFKEWLQSTRKMMQEHDGEALHEADRALLLAACERLQLLLGDAIVLNWGIQGPRLIKILTPARDLFRKLHSAKADFHVEMMPVRYANGVATFDTDTMTAIQSDEEETELLGLALQISVFPGVYKFGDEMGQNMEEVTTVCKAKVVVQKPNAAKEDTRIKVEE